MKKGKIILASAAFLITAASALAFKASLKFGHPHVYGKTSSGSCTLTTCVTAAAGTVSSCKTEANKIVNATGSYKTSTCVQTIPDQHFAN